MSHKKKGDLDDLLKEMDELLDHKPGAPQPKESHPVKPATAPQPYIQPAQPSPVKQPPQRLHPVHTTTLI
jgi:hypothetical protein